jgi:hypothetical protein
VKELEADASIDDEQRSDYSEDETTNYSLRALEFK